MRQMKDSGIEWIGQIPEEWEILPLKQLFEQTIPGNWGYEVSPELTNMICIRVADFNFEKFSITDKIDYTYRGYPKKDIVLLEYGDILFEKSGGGQTTPVGRSVFFDKNIQATCSNFIEKLSPKSNFYKKFIYYSFIVFYLFKYSHIYIKQTTGIQNFDLKTFISKEKTGVPPLNEQQRIADYLDAQCARIDETMELVRQSKEKLRAYKLSLITEAVTKGLEPDGPMKDSGIPWIGETPATWYFEKLKNLFLFEKGKEAQKYTKEYIGLNNGEFPVYSGQTENNGIMGKISSYDYDIKECIFTTTVGAKAMSAKILSGKFSLSQNCLIMLPKGNFVNVKFIYYLLIVLFEYEKSLIPAYMQPSLRMSDLSTYSFYVPNTYSEQQRIAAYLDEKCARIDALLAEKDELLDKLAEYKKSLIFECVTGKREVAA